MPTFRIPTPLRPYSGGNSQVQVSGDTVGDALEDLTGKYPELRQHLYDGQQLRNFVNIYLNQEDIRYGDGIETTIEEDDTLMIIPSIAGG
ncbi:MAG: MoaD/ThiS family protein [Chloroflexota bacterium]|jgi:molybdopterin converting factor small subunit